MNNKINPFAKSSIIYLLASVIGQGMSFVGIVVFTRMMGQTEYGDYGTYYAFVSIFSVLIGANLFYSLNNAYVDFVEDYYQYRKSVLFLSAFICLTVTAIVSAVCVVFFPQISAFVVLMAAIHSYAFFVINYKIYSSNMENNYKAKLWLLILPNTFQLVFPIIAITLFPTHTFEARILGSVLGLSIVALASFISIFKTKAKLIEPRYWKYSLSISVPTIMMSLSYMLMQQCDKVMITFFCGSNETAIYLVLYYIGFAIIAVDQAIAPVRQAWIFRRINEKDIAKASELQKWYLLIMFVLSAIMIFVGPLIIKLIAPEPYWRFEYIVPFVLSACMMLLYRFFTEILLFYKKNIILSGCVLLCALINIVLNALLIPEIGAVAGCYTTVISYGILFILTGVISTKLYGAVYRTIYFMLFIIGITLLALLYKFTETIEIVRYISLAVILISVCIYMLKNEGWKSILLNKN